MTQLPVPATFSGTVKTQTPVLAAGDWQLREFAAAIATISEAQEWTYAAEIDEACDILKQIELPPELILLAQPLPGTYQQSDVDRLQQCSPLTRIVLVASSWCEGELRTGTPPCGVIRIYWYELSWWWQIALRRRSADLCPLWSLPLDHPQAGRWSSGRDSLAQKTSARDILIDAQDYAIYETLSSSLSEFDITAHWNGRGNHCDSTPTTTAGIWDGSQLDERERSRLTSFCDQTHGPVIALLDFPRMEHLEQAQAAGATAVFGKPYVVEELVIALNGQPVTS